LRKVKKERVAVFKFGVNERGCDNASSGKVESVFHSSVLMVQLNGPPLSVWDVKPSVNSWLKAGRLLTNPQERRPLRKPFLITQSYLA